MMIQQAVLHVLDFHTNACILSQKPLDFTNETVYEYVDKQVSRVLHDPSRQTGVFYATSHYQELLQRYLAGTADFAEVASETAKKLYDILSLWDEPISLDLLFVAFRDDHEENRIGIFLLENKTAYTHQILDDEGSVYSKLIKHYAILPNTTQKVDAYAIVGLHDLSVTFVDKKRRVNGEELLILPERLLQCTAVISGKEAVQKANKIALAVADEFGADPIRVLSKAKQYVAANAELPDEFSPREMGTCVFADSPPLQEAFSEQAAAAGLPETVAVEEEYARKTGTMHKIKTDTGIEITFPSAYIENTEFIQFITNSDGTLSIELKKIAKIMNK
ncbi:nucleoid-associated protein [Megasphaera vaginalis (ex Srinivasan et al. 2021)]|uniref:Nucleoid-associated protein NdpA n=1 Tax=Megasphaera vaginalis (ex Srinivasan et al. 2021) TaxID=1111454 RepID=U7USC2_9FIRM|nr:nucleoid-associated protein [Megasphaera vaginalis (ex Srinivasan et al. 2021)]ERT61794.1 nucleoid-associated protein NdpA [Megasphaera vaginalis (ex Srinivasan et al. 2021)]